MGRIGSWQAGDYLDWARESQGLRRQVYRFETPHRGAVLLPPGYVRNAREILNQRLVQAGVRLAEILNEALCDPAPAR